MSEESGLLRTIIEERDDDAPRLVFADWLEEHGRGNQAEFIRTQVRLAHLQPGDEGFDELKRQEQRLLAQGRTSWIEPITRFLHRSFAPREDPEKLDVFRRGFPDSAFVDLDKFVAEPDAVFDAAPVSGLIFWVRGPLPAKLFDCAGLSRATRLEFLSWRSRLCSQRERSIELDDQDAARLAEGRHFEQVRELRLSSQTIAPEALESLVGSPRWSGLEALDLSHSIDAGCMAVLGTEMDLPRLRRLDLSYSEPGPLQTWREADWPRRLDHLDLAGCDLDIDEVASYFTGGEWPALQTLSLCALHGEDSGGRLARGLQRMPNLRSLDLSCRHFAEPIRSLVLVGRFENLHSLNISAGFRSDTSGLFPTQAFPNLRDLDASSNSLTGQVSGLCDSSFTATLRRLDISGCNLKPAEIVSFATTAQMPHLETLVIGEHGDGCTVKAVEALGSAQGFPRLRSLHIRLRGQDKLYEALAAAPLMSQLRYLHISGNSVNQKCVEKLISLPGFQGLVGLEIPAGPATRPRLREHFGERFLE